MPIFRIAADSQQQLQGALGDALKALGSDTLPASQFAALPYRFSCYYSDLSELRAQLSQAEIVSPCEPKPWCLLFTGQGAQYPAMGHDLMQSFPVVSASLDRSRALFLDAGADISVFFSEDAGDAIHQTQYTQMCMVSLELAVADFWSSVGLPIGCAIGHSIGELAACIHGCYYSRAEGARLVYERASRMQQVDNTGSMLAVRAARRDLENIINSFNSHGDLVEYAGFNSPVQTVLSGSESAISKIKTVLAEQKIKSVELKVSHAFHSRFMDPMLTDFIASVRDLNPQNPDYSVYSNLDGHTLTPSNLSARYWSQQLRSPVDFLRCVDSAWQDGNRCFLEVGPQPVLQGLLGKRFSNNDDILTLSSLNKRQSAIESLLTAACCIDSRITSLNLAYYQAF